MNWKHFAFNSIYITCIVGCKVEITRFSSSVQCCQRMPRTHLIDHRARGKSSAPRFGSRCAASTVSPQNGDWYTTEIQPETLSGSSWPGWNNGGQNTWHQRWHMKDISNTAINLHLSSAKSHIFHSHDYWVSMDIVLRSWNTIGAALSVDIIIIMHK